MSADRVDLAPDIYAYLRQWWGLKSPDLTPTKCRLLARNISAQIFSGAGPIFMTDVNRWGFVAKILAGHPGENRSG